MATKPTPGGSDGTYGTELNAHLDVSLDADGKIKDGAEQTTSAAPDADAQLANKKYVDDRAAALIAASKNDYIKIRQTINDNTAGYAVTTGAWRTVTLASEETDTGGDAALSSNQVTLSAGTYEFRGEVSTTGCGIAQVRLFNTTGEGAEISRGMKSAGSPTNGSPDTLRTVKGRFTIAASQALELQIRTQTNGIIGPASTVTFGAWSNISTLEFWKIN